MENFEQIMELCPKKKVISLCKKLQKKCSFKSGADCEALCHLAYWLYVYEKPGLALHCIERTHDVPFDKNFNVWTFIHAMWGLEMRLLREQGQDGEAQKLAQLIDAHLLTPGRVDTPERMPAKEARRRARFTCEDVIRQEKVERHLQAGDTKGANAWRLTALFGMIGLTETGLYPLLNECRANIEAKTQEYIGELRKT